MKKKCIYCKNVGWILSCNGVLHCAECKNLSKENFDRIMKIVKPIAKKNAKKMAEIVDHEFLKLLQ